MSFEDKSQPMKNFLEGVFGTGTAIKTNVCVFCGDVAEYFRNELSRKEFGISGICQNCQDEVFGK